MIKFENEKLIILKKLDFAVILFSLPTKAKELYILPAFYYKFYNNIFLSF